MLILLMIHVITRAAQKQISDLRYYPSVGIIKVKQPTELAVIKQYTIQTPIVITHHAPNPKFAASKCLSADQIRNITSKLSEVLHAELTKFTEEDAEASETDIVYNNWPTDMLQNDLLNDLECQTVGQRKICSPTHSKRTCEALSCCYDLSTRQCFHHIYAKNPSFKFIAKNPNILPIKSISYTQPISGDTTALPPTYSKPSRI